MLVKEKNAKVVERVNRAMDSLFPKWEDYMRIIAGGFSNKYKITYTEAYSEVLVALWKVILWRFKNRIGKMSRGEMGQAIFTTSRYRVLDYMRKEFTYYSRFESLENFVEEAGDGSVYYVFEPSIAPCQEAVYIIRMLTRSEVLTMRQRRLLCILIDPPQELRGKAISKDALRRYLKCAPSSLNADLKAVRFYAKRYLLEE